MIQTGTIVEILPTRIWVESSVWGSRSVMLQHEGCEAFAYCTFNYDYRYTSNAGTWAEAHDMARRLGAEEPIEHRNGEFPPIRWWHHIAAVPWRIRIWRRERCLSKTNRETA